MPFVAGQKKWMKLFKGTCHIMTTKINLSGQQDSKHWYRTLCEMTYAVINWKTYMLTRKFSWQAGHIFNLGGASFLSVSFGGPLDFLGYGVMKRRILQHLGCAIRQKEECSTCLPHLSCQRAPPGLHSPLCLGRNNDANLNLCSGVPYTSHWICTQNKSINLI